MPGPTSSFQKHFAQVVEASKKIALLTTIGDDLTQAESAKYVQELHFHCDGSEELGQISTNQYELFSGPNALSPIMLHPQRHSEFEVALKEFAGDLQPHDLDPGVRAQYELLRQLQQKLKALDQRLKDEGDQLPKGIRDLHTRRSAAVIEEAEAFERGFSPLPRFLWGAGTGLLIAWQMLISGLGPNTAVIPLSLGTHLRSITIFTQYLLSPASNPNQFRDMFNQRISANLVIPIAYTMSFFWDIYGTKAYEAVTLPASLALV